MQYTDNYNSPLGKILLACDDIGLTGLWFEGQKYYAYHLEKDNKEMCVPTIELAKNWLDIYFDGKEPDFMPPLHIIGTDFQREVWEILLKIPYGKVTTYGDIAAEMAKMRKIQKMSAQAVGNAVGHNAISIIIPCHRVIGKNGSLTGYAGGIERKKMLLKLEKSDISK